MTGTAAPAPSQQCSLLINLDVGVPKVEELKKQLESKEDADKIEGLKTVVSCIINGEPLPQLLMHVIKYCLHTENHTIKKMLLLFWEVVPKTSPDGSLLPEMILVCNAMKNNLNHPNEFIRGATLRFLTVMREGEILESLIPYITENLEHRHSYVRKNAALAVYTVFENHPDLIPDAPDLVEKFLYEEANASAKRNAFLMLCHCDQEKAVTYLNTVLETLSSQEENFQLVALDLIRQVVRSEPTRKKYYLRCIYNLTNSASNTVAFEAANTLVMLSSAPTALRAAVGAYCRLLQAESDNNVKLVILGRLVPLKKRHEKILEEMLMDIMRALNTPNVDIWKQTLDLALDLVSARTAEEVVALLKKEMIKTQTPGQSSSDEFRKLLVEAMHKCAVRFPQVASTVVQLLMNYLGDDSLTAAMDVVHFVREVVEAYPELRNTVLSKLMESFDEIRKAEVYRVALWILGEYAQDPGVLEASLAAIYESVGELPLRHPHTEEGQQPEEGETKTGAAAGPRKPLLLADGTYAQQSAVESSVEKTDDAAAATTLRHFLMKGDYFLGAALCNTITKLLLRFCVVTGYGTPDSNTELAKGLLLMTSILRLGAPGAKHRMDKDSQQRVTVCIKTLLNPKALSKVFLECCRVAYSDMVAEERKAQPKEEEKKAGSVNQPDELINIRQLSGAQLLSEDFEDQVSDLSKAVEAASKTGDFAQQLNRVYQLTGFADPVYAEASVTVLDYDIVLDILVVNQTNAVLQNLMVEISTSRDLKVVERPQTYNLAPYDFVKIQANIKVSSTESGVIFGNIVYDGSSGSQKEVVVMNSIHMDIVDYINPATCTPQRFRSMWAEFEWENKIAVNTDISDIRPYVQHIQKITNMKCLTPDQHLEDDCGFISANLYARSIFGEHAVLNVSVRKTEKVVGYIRIRCKSQGIALSLGDKITNHQRTAVA